MLGLGLYVDDELAEHIAGIVDKTYRNQQYLQQIAKLKAQGKSDAQIFSQLYQTISDKPSDVESAAAVAAEAAAAAVDVVEESQEQQACSLLLDTYKLDKTSRTRLAKICAKIDKATAQEQAASQQSSYADTAPVRMTAADIAKQTQAHDKFNQLLGEIAIEDMQTQAKHISLSDEDDELIEKLKPHFEASYDFNYDAYKATYQLLLLSQ